MLRQMGTAVEERRGPWRFLLLPLVTAVISNLAQYYLDDISWIDGGLVVKPGPAFGGMSGVLYGLFGYMWMKSRLAPELGLARPAAGLLDDRVAVPVHDRRDRLGRQHGPRGRPCRRRGHRRRAAALAATARQAAHVSSPAAAADQKTYGNSGR